MMPVRQVMLQTPSACATLGDVCAPAITIMHALEIVVRATELEITD